MPFKDPEKEREWRRSYNARPEVKERKNKNHREYYAKNKSKLLPRINKNSRIRRKKLKIEILTEYSKKKSGALKPTCACCGEDFHEIFLSLDHIIPKSRNKQKRDPPGYLLYVRLKKEGFPDGFQVLCFNCNTAKGTLEHCPHEMKK